MPSTGGRGQCPARSRGAKRASSAAVRALRLLPCLPTGNCADDRHSEASGPLGSRDERGPCCELGAELLRFQSKPHSGVISADAGSEAEPLRTERDTGIESMPSLQGPWSTALDHLLVGTGWNQTWRPFSLQAWLSDLSVNQKHLGGLSHHSWLGPTPTLKTQ